MTAASPPHGRVIWITGYSGAGKTTVAQALQARWRACGGQPLLLDGDVLRAIFGSRHGYSEADRRALAASYGRLCAELSRQGANVICATISMFDEVREWNRAHIPGYCEVYLKVPLQERLRRDPKGLYRSTGSDSASPMVGVHQQFDEPKSPDLVIENFGPLTVPAAVDRIWSTFLKEHP